MTINEAREFILKHSHDAGRVLGRWAKEQRDTWNQAWAIVEEAKRDQYVEFMKSLAKKKKARNREDQEDPQVATP